MFDGNVLQVASICALCTRARARRLTNESLGRKSQLAVHTAPRLHIDQRLPIQGLVEELNFIHGVCFAWVFWVHDLKRRSWYILSDDNVQQQDFTAHDIRGIREEGQADDRRGRHMRVDHPSGFYEDTRAKLRCQGTLRVTRDAKLLHGMLTRGRHEARRFRQEAGNRLHGESKCDGPPLHHRLIVRLRVYMHICRHIWCKCRWPSLPRVLKQLRELVQTIARDPATLTDTSHTATLTSPEIHMKPNARNKHINIPTYSVNDKGAAQKQDPTRF